MAPPAPVWDRWPVESRHGGDHAFTDSIPDIYDRYLVPLIFDVYAVELTARIARLRPASVLEIAAGTGALTRAMAAGLPETVAITATDLHQPMLDHAAALGTDRPVTWRQADGMALPFDDGSFDVVACQFGMMFMPDHAGAFAEVRRVLRGDGVFLFTVWDRIEENEFADVVTEALATLFPDDPPRFLARAPYAYFDRDLLQADLTAGGFTAPATFDALEARSLAASCAIPAIGFCHGSPLRHEIEARDPGGLDHATSVASAAIEARYGPTDIDGKMRAIIVTADKR